MKFKLRRKKLLGLIFFLSLYHYSDLLIIFALYNPFRQDYDLSSHITHIVCVNFVLEQRDFSWHVYLLSELPEKC